MHIPYYLRFDSWFERVFHSYKSAAVAFFESKNSFSDSIFFRKKERGMDAYLHQLKFITEGR